jgi:hypothetical protein
MSKQTTNKQSASDLESEVAALDQQIAHTATELEAKRQQLTEARAAAAAKATEMRRQVEAELIEKKVGEFVAVAAALDHAMTVAGMAAFKKLASELHMAGRVRQAHAARESLVSRMKGESVHRMPFPSWSAMAAAWLIPTPAKVA